MVAKSDQSLNSVCIKIHMTVLKIDMTGRKIVGPDSADAMNKLDSPYYIESRKLVLLQFFLFS
uniref:Uncharacterized protein n=1 Tax=Rhizophagus irregularis (strain DAOM 181602 / DAOM 197198 / MUCL 43194) TaxID=747089 RepID=U9TBN6_RHIID